METKNFHNTNGTVVGYFRDEGERKIYRKKVQGSKHLLRVMDAWGIDTQIVAELFDLGCTEIRIKDTETETIYSVSYQKFTELAVERDFVGKQLFLPRRYWTAEQDEEKVK